MPSSKFSSPKRYYKRPAVCIKSPKGYPPLADPYLPPQLTAEVQWADYDPGILDFNYSRAIVLLPKPNPRFYGGSTPDGLPSIHVTIHQTDQLGNWRATIILTDTWGAATWWQEFYVDRQKHSFDSGLHQKVTVPNIDFRTLRVIG